MKVNLDVAIICMAILFATGLLTGFYFGRRSMRG